MYSSVSSAGLRAPWGQGPALSYHCMSSTYCCLTLIGLPVNIHLLDGWMTGDTNEVCSSQNYLFFKSTMGWLKERAIKDNIPSQCSELTESIITFLFSKNLISQIIGVQTQHKCKKITFNILEYLFRLFLLSFHRNGTSLCVLFCYPFPLWICRG